MHKQKGRATSSSNISYGPKNLALICNDTFSYCLFMICEHKFKAISYSVFHKHLLQFCHSMVKFNHVNIILPSRPKKQQHARQNQHISEMSPYIFFTLLRYGISILSSQPKLYFLGLAFFFPVRQKNSVCQTAVR